MSDANRGIEDLLLSTLDAVSRFRMGRLEALSAALDAGRLLTEAKRRFPHGEWGDWLGRVGLAPRTASRWMRLPALGITAEDVIAQGGINATLRGKSATVADLPGESDAPNVSDLQRELEETEEAIVEVEEGPLTSLRGAFLAFQGQGAAQGCSERRPFHLPRPQYGQGWERGYTGLYEGCHPGPAGLR